MQSEEIRLVVDGHVHERWEQYRIDSDLLTPADGWDAALCGNAESTPQLPDYVQEGASMSIMVGDDLVLTGMIDDVWEDNDRLMNTARLTGRDNGSVLEDCSAPLLDLQQATLDQVITRAVRPLGITRVAYRATPKNPRQRVHTEPGQSVWEWLLSACEANHVWPWFDPDGTLVIGAPDYTTAPVADLVMNINGEGNNVERCSIRRSIVDRFSDLTVLGQAAGTGGDGQNAIHATVKDPAVRRYRPKVVIDGNCETLGLATARAKKLSADGRMSALTITLTVKGHRIRESANGDGRLWAPGMRANLRLEHRGYVGTYFLMKRTFRLSRAEGKLTELHFIEDGSWMLNLDVVKAKRRKDYHRKRQSYLGAAGDDE